MTKINDCSRVNPISRRACADDYRVKNMLLRDYFAGQAMTAFYSSFDARDARTSRMDLEGDARLFFDIADAMLAARIGGQNDE